MSAKAGKRPLRSLTANEKLIAIRRVHDGESKASVARDIGVPESTLRGWCKNEEKISYLSRQSSPENDDADLIKKPKLDVDAVEPYNLSMKSTPVPAALDVTTSPTTTTPTAIKTEQELTKTKQTSVTYTKAESSTTPKTTSSSSSREKERESERNRAELARLSAEFGLNRPEVLFSSLNNANSSDLAGILLQLNLYQQKVAYQNQIQQQQQQSKTKVTAAADTTKSVSPNNGLLTTVDQAVSALPTLSNDQLYDYASVWLRQQSLMASLSAANLQTTTPSTSSATPATNAQSLLNGMNSYQKSKFWNWYKYGYNTSVPAATTPVEKPILYQQLTKESQKYSGEVQQNCENLSTSKTEEPKPKTSTNGHTKSRSVLDNLLLNNNTIHQDGKRTESEEINQDEALEHGEKFLQWLESCSDPSVTTVQIMTLQSLIKNLKSGADRRNNGDHQSKAKVKRK